MSTIEIYLADPESGAFREWDHDSGAAPRLRQAIAFAAEGESHESLCELAFAIANSYPGELHCPEAFEEVVVRYRAERHRSLSVGDVVTVDGAGYMCAAMGFRSLDHALSLLAAGGPGACRPERVGAPTREARWPGACDFYADLGAYPPEHLRNPHVPCAECTAVGEQAGAVWLLLGHEAGATVGVPVCARHLYEVRRAPGRRR